MAAFVRSGHAIDVVIAVMLIEVVVLIAVGRRPAGAAIALVLPGALFLIATRAALIGADWRWVATPLGLAFPAHLLDLRVRGWIGRRRADGAAVPAEPALRP